MKKALSLLLATALCISAIPAVTAMADEKPYEGRYDDTIEPEIPGAKAYLGDLAESEEDVLSYVAFPQQAEAFLKERKEKKALKVSYTITEAK